MNETDIHNIQYKPLTCGDLPAFAGLYDQRSNLCCESSVLDGFMWRRAGHTVWTIVDDECLLMIEKIEAESYAGSLPFCPEDKLCDYFLLQQRYFNEVLHQPLQILYADETGKNVLEASGLLEGYAVSERENLADYLYDAQTLRTLAGRKLSKKRNHIHKFETEYGGRWEYVTLTSADKDEVLALFDEWADAKAQSEREAVQTADETAPLNNQSGESAPSKAETAYPEKSKDITPEDPSESRSDLVEYSSEGSDHPRMKDVPEGPDYSMMGNAPEGEDYARMEYNNYDRYGNVELELEHDVIVDIFSCPEYLKMVRAGGIRIDGRLRAFSIACYNSFDKMAVINIEKAMADVNGLYPVLSQQFLLHEFPEAVLVNREDDAGDPGLRQSKLSYYPRGYARKYLIRQTDF